MSEIYTGLAAVRTTVARHLPKGLPRPVDADVWETIDALTNVIYALANAMAGVPSEVEDPYKEYLIDPITVGCYTARQIGVLSRQPTIVFGYLEFGSVKIWRVSAYMEGRTLMLGTPDGIDIANEAETQVRSDVQEVFEIARRGAYKIVNQIFDRYGPDDIPY
jgi:hypothetical protein